MNLALDRIAHLLQTESPRGDALVTGWSIDSRTTNPGDLFFALRGQQHDGHDHVPAALSRGAVAAVVERPLTGAVLVVAHAERALATIAAQARQWWDGTVVGVTGSAGKTSTKDIVAQLLGVDHPTGKTIGNLNNHLGVPLSLLRLADTSRFGVLEMGMNHAGEIRHLCEIAQPQVGVVTNVGYAHLENFASVEGIAAAKRELIEALPSSGLAVLNHDDDLVRQFSFAGHSVRYGLQEGADVRPDQYHLGAAETTFSFGGVTFATRLTGRHSLLNILAGISVAREFGGKLHRLRDAVAELAPDRMRGERLDLNGITVINDCYNSNPAAARAMLDVLAATPATRHIAVLGEMLELGPQAAELHRGVGDYAARNGVTVLLGIGGAARHLIDAGKASGLDASAALFFDQPEAAGAHLQSIARVGDAILFKGSRGVRTELALARFLEGR